MLNNYLPTDYQNFIALSRYARWKDDEQRRETWIETVDRYSDYMANHLYSQHNYTITKALKYTYTHQNYEDYQQVYSYSYNQRHDICLKQYLQSSMLSC